MDPLAARVAARFVSASLTLGPARVDAKATESLKKMKKIPARNRGDLESAIMSAASYAQKAKKTGWVYLGNSYMHAVWQVASAKGDAVNSINNTGTRVISVDPDLTVTWYDVHRPTLVTDDGDTD